MKIRYHTIDIVALTGFMCGVFMLGVVGGWVLAEIFGTIGPAIWADIWGAICR